MSNTIELDKTKYSKIERDMFRLLSFSYANRISTSEIAMGHFGREKIYGRHNVTSRMKGLNQKFAENDEWWQIAKTERQGPRQVEYWLKKLTPEERQQIRDAVKRDKMKEEKRERERERLRA